MINLKNTCYSFCLAALLSFGSCNDTSDETSTTSAPAVTTAPAADTNKSIWKDNGAANVQTLPQTPPATSSPGIAGVNPAHGQPNHRCDIAVGAPLSTPRQQVAQPATSAPTLPATSAPGASTVRLNPAHGQPGHDCAVPVGQPLKSV